MKKIFNLTLILLTFCATNAQEKKKENAKDTVKTEVVNVVTKYNPKIADANKIKNIPNIKLLAKNKKRKLKYTIFSAPVTSTFIPKTGVVKGIDVGLKEKIYSNYLATGYGNYNTPFVETFLHYSTRFKNEIGFYAKYISSFDNIRKSELNSSYSNFKSSIFYKQEDRYFDWKITLNSQQNTYNWFGIPDYLKETAILNLIGEEQTYNYFELIGDLDFKDSLIKKSKAQISYFSDAFESREIFASFNTKFSFPLYFISNNLIVDTNIEYLNGNFKQDYLGYNVIDYSIFTLKINPKYAFNLGDFSFKGGFKTYVSLDTENSATNILIYPEFTVTKPIIKKTINAYLGATGDLKTNTYKRFTEENPYVSPTLFITQTSEKINAFFGVNGSINNDMSFNFKTSYKQEEDKPLFIRNNSKSNGTFATANSNSLKGYEYGNSFKIFYDNVKTLSLFGEFTYDISKKITTNLNIEYNSYTVSKHYEAWNLPEIQAAIIGKYKADKWYATTNIFYVGERNIVTYNGQFPSSLATPSTLSSFVDFNLNGGYHFNDKFSVFLKMNNVLNANYQRFSNFNVQGFQFLGGLTYKFDF